MINRRLIAVPVLLALAVGAAAYWWYGRPTHEASNRLTLYGNVDVREVQLAFQVSGRIERMLVPAGTRVAAGQPVAELDSARFEDAVALAKARAESAAQHLAALEAGSRPAEVRRARAQVAAASAAADSTAANYKRLKGLARQQFVSPQALEDARAAADRAKAQLDANKETLALTLAGPRREEIAAARADLRAAQAQLALNQRDLSDAELTAPSAGVIRDRILEPGDMASPDRPAYTLALNDPLWVRAYVPETSLGRIHGGMMATVTTDSFPGKQYRGWIGYISPTAEFTPQTVETPEVRTDLVYEVRVYVCNPAGELRLGMPATVTVPTGPDARSIDSAEPQCEESPQ